jgi:tetratricopeptide (TPR) repeat protein
MRRAASRSSLIVVGLIVLTALVAMMGGCGDDGTATSTTVSSSASTTLSADGTTATTATGESSSERIVAGGKTAEEYAAELPDLEKAAAASPEDIDALQQLAIAQYNTSDYEGAAATYEKMLALKGDAFTQNNYGNVLRDWGKTDEAKAAYEKAISADKTLATAYVNLASMYAQEDKVDEAVKVLDRGLAAVGDDDKTQLENYKTQLTAKG